MNNEFKFDELEVFINTKLLSAKDDCRRLAFEYDQMLKMMLGDRRYQKTQVIDEYHYELMNRRIISLKAAKARYNALLEVNDFLETILKDDVEIERIRNDKEVD